MANRADEKGWLRDQNLRFSGGVDGGRSPSDIERDQIANGVNCTVRGGNAKPRPGWLKRLTTFASDYVQTGFQTGFFQEASFYNGNGMPALISSHSGRQFRLDLETFSVIEITPTKGYSTFTTAQFIIPAVNGNVTVTVSDTSRLSLQFPNITIAGYSLTLTAINSSAQIVVQNLTLANVGVVVPVLSAASFVGYDSNNPTIQKNWSLAAEQFWILQDNQGAAIIFDGAKTYRSDPAKQQIPTGNIMAYVNGRIAVSLPDRRSYRVGDIVLGSSGTALYNGLDAILYFTENNFLNEGGDFSARVFGAPSQSGDIKSMKSTAQTDTALGQGPLLVGTPNVQFTVNLPFDRTIWKNLANALQTANPLIGPVGQDSTLNINADQWYRSRDGWRSYILAQRQFNGAFGNTTQSNEVDEILEFDTQEWLEFGSAVLFDNRLLGTISPQMTPNGCFHRGLVVMDFDLTSELRKKFAPCWEGVWTGVRILKIVTATVNDRERCFLYVLNDQNQIELWELSTSDKFDNGVQQTRINWSIETPSYNCGDSDRFKKLKTGRLLVSNLSGSLNATITYRTDEAECYSQWDQFTECAKNCDVGPFDCSGPVSFADQPRRPIPLVDPPEDFDPVTNRLKSVGYEFQCKMQFTGFMELKSLRLFAMDEPEVLATDRQDGISRT